MSAKKLVITLPEYERIFRVVHSVSCCLNNGPAPSCLFLNTIGCYVLGKSLGVDARSVMGDALIRLDGRPGGAALAFADLFESEETSVGERNFHCWVETADHIIDFTAPAYREYLVKAGLAQSVPRRMFQKLKSDMAAGPDQLNQEGDFFLLADPELTNHYLRKAMAKPATGDLAHVCTSWFKRPPKRMATTFQMVNDLGTVTTIRQTDIRIDGAW